MDIYGEKCAKFGLKIIDEYKELLREGICEVLEGKRPSARLMFAYPDDIFHIANEYTDGEPFKLRNKMVSHKYTYDMSVGGHNYVLELDWYYGWNSLFYRGEDTE